MGSPNSHTSVMLVTAATSRYTAALDWARRRATEHWGPMGLVGPQFEFVETEYYQSTMGRDLKKQFWALAALVDPAELPSWKLATNAWEVEYAKLANHPEPRPLNLDPGYLTPAKLVLASTKDHSHRIYLERGIFAEVTLYYKAGRWQPREWTYPDYRRADYHEFFTQLRAELLRRAREAGTT